MKLIFPTDEHAPFHDPKALSVALKIAEDFNPDLRFAGSDGIDFYGISHFDKNPKRVKAGGLQNEIDQWAANQRMWKDATPNAEVKFIVGNHEDRLRRFVWKNAQLDGLRALTLPELLEFDELGITWDDKYGEMGNLEVELYKKLIVKHGKLIRKYSAYTARAEIEDERYSISVIHGHTHRGGTFFTRTRHGLMGSYEGFCLCTLEPEYVHRPDWQHGMVIAEVTNTSLSVEPIPFHGYRNRIMAIWRGKEYTS